MLLDPLDPPPLLLEPQLTTTKNDAKEAKALNGIMGRR
jgi:hypothetical protein